MLDQDRIIKVNIETEMRKSYIDYCLMCAMDLNLCIVAFSME